MNIDKLINDGINGSVRQIRIWDLRYPGLAFFLPVG